MERGNRPLIAWAEEPVRDRPGGRQGSLPPGARVGSHFSGIVSVIRVYYTSSDFSAMRVRDPDGHVIQVMEK